MKKRWIAVWCAVLALWLLMFTVPALAEEASLPEGEAEESAPEVGTEEVPKDAVWTFEEVKAYVNGTVIPAAVLVATAIGTLYVSLLPLIGKIKATNKTFKEASGEIKETASESQKTKEDMNTALGKLTASYNQLLSKYGTLEAAYNAMAQQVNAAMSSMAQVLEANTGKMVDASGKMEKMMIVGFCNNRELMEKGYARKIAQIGAGVEVDMNEIVGAEEAGGASPSPTGWCEQIASNVVGVGAFDDPP